MGWCVLCCAVCVAVGPGGGGFDRGCQPQFSCLRVMAFHLVEGMEVGCAVFTCNSACDHMFMNKAAWAWRMTVNTLFALCWLQAQGGEFPVVVMPVHKRAGKLLKRQLLYTAVSRAQKLLVMVGTQAAIEKCLHNAGAAALPISRFRAKLRSARVQAGLPTIERGVFGAGGWE